MIPWKMAANSDRGDDTVVTPRTRNIERIVRRMSDVDWA